MNQTQATPLSDSPLRTSESWEGTKNLINSYTEEQLERLAQGKRGEVNTQTLTTTHNNETRGKFHNATRHSVYLQEGTHSIELVWLYCSNCRRVKRRSLLGWNMEKGVAYERDLTPANSKDVEDIFVNTPVGYRG